MNSVRTISVENASVKFRYGRGLFKKHPKYLTAVDNVSLDLFENETLALVGESGSGKSTLGLSILGLRSLFSGNINWRGTSLAEMRREEMSRFRRDVQVVFQDPYGSLNPRQTILETLRRPLLLHKTVPRGEINAYVRHLLDRVGLSPSHLYLDRYPHEFSGGQRQRIAIARALVLKPSVLVADEPVSALDVSIRTQVLNLLNELKSDLKLSMLFLSHDLGVVRFIADRVAVMYLGKIVELGTVEKIFERAHHPYTRVLLSAAPSVDPTAGRRYSVDIIGEPAKPSDPPPGCRFSTRCPFVFDRCRVEEPALRTISNGHASACHLEESPSLRFHNGA